MLRPSVLLLLVGVNTPANCMEWAFGVDWREKQATDSDEYWNLHHADYFKIPAGGDIDEFLIRVGRAYLKYLTANKLKNV